MPTLAELLQGGHSALQGASNAAASNITGPVDLLALLLKKGGVPIPDEPMGGSAWAKRMGLTREPENKMMGLLGEGAGLAAPFVAAAKAPQIAGGLKALADDFQQYNQALGPGGSKVVEFPSTFSRQERSTSVKEMAENLAQELKNRKFQATVEHSGSAVGPSSYVKIFDPETGRFVVDPVRVSDHSKGAFNSQFVHDIRGTADAPDFAPVFDLVEKMRSQGPTKLWLKQNK